VEIDGGRITVRGSFCAAIGGGCGLWLRSSGAPIEIVGRIINASAGGAVANETSASLRFGSSAGAMSGVRLTASLRAQCVGASESAGLREQEGTVVDVIDVAVADVIAGRCGSGATMASPGNAGRTGWGGCVAADGIARAADSGDAWKHGRGGRRGGGDVWATGWANPDVGGRAVGSERGG
jgi:hypothetical protein